MNKSENKHYICIMKEYMYKIINHMNNCKKIKISRQRSKEQIVSSVKHTRKLQANIHPLEIEVSNTFAQVVIAKNNPAIRQAKNHGIAYTIARGANIIRVHGVNSSVIGKVAKDDVTLSKGMVYKFK